MISDSTFDLMREAWFQSIPEQYRLNDKAVRTDIKGRGVQSECCRHLSSAIILPPPPRIMLERFFENIFAARHVSIRQLNMKHKPRKKGEPWSSLRRERSRARLKEIETNPCTNVEDFGLTKHSRCTWQLGVI